MSFADHFSGHASAYARYRPTYPDALYEAVLSHCVSPTRAWDCGTGNGQAAVQLARYVDEVIATDASAEQIRQAIPHERVRYLVAPAGDVPLEDKSVDLVTVAQAIHWFDHDAFYREVRRVVRPGGVIAAWTYTLFYASPEDLQAPDIDAVLQHFYDEVVGPYWPPERRHIEAAYQSIPFPFEEQEAPELTLTMDWTLAEVVGYLRTWSASQRYREQVGTDPIREIEENLRAAWGDPETVRTLHWPAPMRIGRVNGSRQRQ
jgi:ubiquinone/menaquinone biosynthesis C-methylase UbiE